MIARQSRSNFEDFALPEGTFSYYAEHCGRKIHCKGISDAEGCIDGWLKRDCQEVALWIGNSQIHGVNQFRDGQETASPILFRHLSKFGMYFLTFSFPNANFQEEYVLFEYLRRRLKLKVLVLPVVFISFRESGVRDDIAKALLQPEIKDSLKSTTIGERILTECAAKAVVQNVDLGAVLGTIQEHSESFLNNWLNQNFSLWAARPQARGQLVTTAYRLRNAVFGIKPQSQRRMIKGRYQENMAALEAMIDAALKENIKVILYTTPIRHDVPLPYLTWEYMDNKNDVRRLAEEKGAVYADLDEVVPDEFWGQKGSTNLDGSLEADFFHFQASGHAILAKELASLLEFRTLGRAR